MKTRDVMTPARVVRLKALPGGLRLRRCAQCQRLEQRLEQFEVLAVGVLTGLYDPERARRVAEDVWQIPAARFEAARTAFAGGNP